MQRDRPFVTANFFPVGRNGLGDPANSYAHSMAWFGDHLYVGFTRFVLSAVKPYDAEPEFDIWPVKVPDVPWENDWRAQIWRYHPPSGRWEQVYVSPLCMGSLGFEIPRHIGFRDMAVFQGESDPHPVLYVTSWGSHLGEGPFVLRSPDGVHFEEVSPAGYPLFGNQTLRSLVAFKGRLFTSPTGRCSGPDLTHDEMIVLESRDPARGAWTKVSTSYFGDPTNLTVFDMAVCQGFLYAGTMNPFEGFQLWKTDAEGPPPYRWTKVISHGAYRGKLNEVACSMCEFDGNLIVGSGIYNCGYDRLYKVGPGAPEVIRVRPDDSWELLIGEPRQTPDGLRIPAGGMGPGFDNPFAGYVWRMSAHEGALYVGTCVWSPWLPFARRASWPEALRRALETVGEATLLKEFGGFDLWRSTDGRRWMPMTRNGFGNRFNSGCRTMASSPHGLFVGTVNQFGPEVAVRRAVGWRYERNRKGGVEVWLGTHDDALRVAAAPGGGARVIAPTADEDAVPDPVSAFFQGTDWRHVGYWRMETETASEAGENLIEELVAFTRPAAVFKPPRPPSQETLQRWIEARGHATAATPPGQERPVMIVEIGCRRGATTRALTAHFPGARLTAFTDSEADLGVVRVHAPDARVLTAPLPRLPRESGLYDLAFCVEGPGQWGDRAMLLREAFRALKAGGRLLCADVVAPDRDANAPADLTAYRRLLEASGFAEIEVLDVSEHSTRPFSRRLSEHFTVEILEGALDANAIPGLLDGVWQAGEVPAYYLVSARRPLGA